jgi:hypothetical protein
MADERVEPPIGRAEGIDQEYLGWLKEIEFFSAGSGFERSDKSSIGACLACVLALDPCLQDLESLSSVARKLARAMGCERYAAEISAVCAQDCRQMLFQHDETYPPPKPQGVQEPALSGDLSIRVARGRALPHGVTRIPIPPEAVRTEALTDKTDDVAAVLVAARHFQDISMHVHTTLSRLVSWGGRLHPAGVVAGFQSGARYGVDRAALERIGDAESKLYSRIAEVAERLALLWIPKRPNTD